MMIHRKNNLKSKGRCEMVTLCLIVIVWVAANNWWKRYLAVNHPEQAERLQEVERQRKEARQEMFKKAVPMAGAGVSLLLSILTKGRRS
jgi:uncharacterized iron-regulated membrane protein